MPLAAPPAGTRIERVTPGEGPSLARSQPTVSDDGRFVAFVSSATDLVPGDTNRAPGVFVRDVLTGAVERVGTASDGRVAWGCSAGAKPYDICGSYGPSLSGDGRYVAFTSGATNLVWDDVNHRPDVFVKDRATGATERVSVAADGTQANGTSDGAALSQDGRYVVFGSTASNLVPGDPGRPGGSRYVVDRSVPTVTPDHLTGLGRWLRGLLNAGGFLA